MIPLLKIPAKFLGILLQICALIAFLVSYILKLNLPKARGAIVLEGINGPIEIIRDERGIPHIMTKSKRDMWFACGFVHAQDRLWQLELQRRLASGTLCEIFGEKTLDADRFMRRIGLKRYSKKQLPGLSGEVQDSLRAYSDGINAFLRKTPWWRLPLEFILLRFKPKPWTPEDSAAIVKFIGFILAPNWDTQIERSRLIQRLGPKKAALLEPQHIDITTGLALNSGFDLPEITLLEEYTKTASWLLPMFGASNTWAVDGTKSASGKPLLANDTHNPAHFPSFWYELHLCSEDTNIIGISIPGIPGVIAGHNQYIAWGVSAALLNQQDLYVETLSPTNPALYWHEKEWPKGEFLVEQINIRGKKPIQERVFTTRHGPVISDLIPGVKKVLALKSVPLESLDILEAAAKVMESENWGEFRNALAKWSSPPLHFVYADKEGHIGYSLAGFSPNRPNRSGLIPARGWLAEDEWKGYIPFEEHPFSFNPPSHIVAAANHCPKQTSSFRITGEWADSYRLERITELLAEKQQLTPEDFKKMQSDVYSRAANDLMGFVRTVNSEDPKLSWALRELKNWNCELGSGSAAACIFEVFAYCLYQNIFRPELGEDTNLYMGKGIHAIAHVNALGYRAASNLLRALRDFRADWLVGARENNPKLLTPVFLKSLQEALDYLEAKLGKNRNKWQWGKIHTVTFPHPFKDMPLLGRLFKMGPYPLGGDMNTIPQASYHPMQPFACTFSIVTWRHIIDCADFTESVSVLPPGQSGHPNSPNADDQINLWLDSQYRPLRFDIETTRNRKTSSILKLVPKKQS